jgi:hypothetical protein
MSEISGTGNECSILVTFYRIILWYPNGTTDIHHCDADNYEDALVQFHDAISYFSGKGIEFELVKVMKKV